MENRNRIWSLLALTGLTTTGIAAWQPQSSPLQILKGEPNRLMMQFRGVKPAMVEVVVDGLIVATRHLSGRADQLTLDLQSAGLAPGSHEATIKLYDAQGRLISQRQTRIELLPDPHSPLTIVVPRNGSQLAGDVPIEARLNRSGQAYVSFFVDGQIRGLRNYPPYVYNWDTTRETNGWHTIEVWSYDGNQTLKTPPMRVYVNNPGGRTERQSTEAVEATAEPETALVESAPVASENVLRVAVAPETRLSESTRLSAPAAPEAEPTEPVVQTETVGIAPAPTIEAMVEAQPSPNRLSAPQEEPSLRAVETAPMQAVHLARAAETEPQMRGQKLRAPLVASTPAKASPGTSATSRWMTIELGTRLPAAITRFEVALDGALLSCDVAPLVENGIALVPLRPVLEQLGARLRWDNQSKTAYAELNGQTIALHVRQNEIVVNGTSVPADAPLRILRGRVLVPASALREMLDVETAFDGANGQLVINTGRE
ncbi:MAG: stalk domain-containing protein [Fimbriimonadales bacterium]|nr:stalk domain-containing protein [Fimbriimonadales bacterium]